MTRTTNARIAGFTYLFYIAAGITTLVRDRATKAGIAEHAGLERFRFGPLEWVWRTLTYARYQPLRRAT